MLSFNIKELVQRFYRTASYDFCSRGYNISHAVRHSCTVYIMVGPTVVVGFTRTTDTSTCNYSSPDMTTLVQVGHTWVLTQPDARDFDGI
jgi:hypothetical protein